LSFVEELFPVWRFAQPQKTYLRSCSILNKLVSAVLRAAETSIYRSRAERANGKCERFKI
jgi:hypothetical protein